MLGHSKHHQGVAGERVFDELMARLARRWACSERAYLDRQVKSVNRLLSSKVWEIDVKSVLEESDFWSLSERAYQRAEFIYGSSDDVEVYFVVIELRKIALTQFEAPPDKPVDSIARVYDVRTIREFLNESGVLQEGTLSDTSFYLIPRRDESQSVPFTQVFESFD